MAPIPEKYLPIAVGEQRTIRYAGRFYQAIVLEIGKTAFRARFTTGKGTRAKTKSRCFARETNPAYWAAIGLKTADQYVAEYQAATREEV